MAIVSILSSIEEGSMRFRWNETNQNRIRYFQQKGIGQPTYGTDGKATLCAGLPKTLVSLELIHSRKVYALSVDKNETISALGSDDVTVPLKGLQGDGFITDDCRLVPCVTVADCMPLWFHDDVSGVFGVVHSGWKGTGIIIEALRLAESVYGSRLSDMHVEIGPHIHDCCYNVDPERVAFFSEKFGSDCIIWRNGIPFLSLQQANLNALVAFGVPREHITTSNDCTCCRKYSGSYCYGSFRRQTAGLPADMNFEEKSKRFTVMAAAIVSE